MEEGCRVFNSIARSPPRYCGSAWLENRFDTGELALPPPLCVCVCECDTHDFVCFCTPVCVQVQYGRLVEIRGQLVLLAFHHVGSGNGARVVRGSGQSLYP